jgi:hypothetical protein
VSVFLQHYFCGLNHGGDFVTDLQFHFIGTSFRDYALYQILSHANNNMGHDTAELEFNNFAFETFRAERVMPERIPLVA